jgi:hypothetical protein
MATDLGQAKASATAKHETFVEQQLAKTQGRIRALDTTAAILVFLIGTFVYALGMSLLDRALLLPSWVRVLAFVLYGVGALVFLGLALGRPLLRRVNPYYAARQLEQTLPGAKNSVVNWLDLHEQNLPPVIRGALGVRAAKDLSRANPEQAVSGQRNLWLGGILTGLILGLFILFLLGPGQFADLMRRAFAPFSEGSIAARTRPILLLPQNGNITVLVGQKVEFKARIEGREPAPGDEDAPRLQFRYEHQESYTDSQDLKREKDVDGTHVWVTTLSGDRIRNGIWYRVTAGDGATEEYRINVQAGPQVNKFLVTYHPRPYLRVPDEKFEYPNKDEALPHLAGVRGTAVTLEIKANRALKAGKLEVVQNGARLPDVPGEVQADDHSMRFSKFVLDQPGTYRVVFTSRDGESNTDQSFYTIKVLKDRAPEVVLTKPGKDVKLPANGTLQLLGKAADDFGVKSLTLRLRVVKGDTQPVLMPKPYRGGKIFELANKRYPDQVDYKDFVALEKVQDEGGKAFALKPGMEVEYWLEAIDNCDYPDGNKGNVGESKRFKVLIAEPDKNNQEQKKQRQQAEQEQQKHEQKQDEKLKEQSKQANKKKDQQGNPQGGKQEQDEKLKQEQDKANKLQQEINKREQQEASKGAAKPADSQQPKGGNKGDGQKNAETKPDEKKGEAQPQPNNQQGGDKKGDGGDAKKEAGASKGAGDKTKPGAEQPAGAQKEGGKSGEDKGIAKGTGNKTDNPDKEKGIAKAPPSTDKRADKARGKEGDMNPSEIKGAPPPAPKAQPQAQGTAKGDKKGDVKCAESKGDGKGEKTEAKAGAKGGDPAKAGGEPGTQKQGEKGQATGVAKGEKAGPDPEKATLEDINQLRKELEKAELKQRKDQAAEELAKLERNAKDPGVRKAAKEALKKFEEETENAKTGTVKSGKTPGDKSTQAQAKGPPEDKKGDSGQVKKGEPKENGASKGGTPGNSGVAKGGKQPAGSTAGGAPPENPKASAGPDSPEDDGTGRFNDKAGELQLENIKKKITEADLKKAGWTKKEFDDWLRAYEEALKQHKTVAAAKEKLATPKGGNSGLFGNQGVRKVNQSTPRVDNLEYGPSRPPPGFEEAQRKFTSGQKK